jgi:hypothetical protein
MFDAAPTELIMEVTLGYKDVAPDGAGKRLEFSRCEFKDTRYYVMSKPPAREIQKQLCELAERIARENFAIELDYSIESIRQVERILGALHDDYKRTRREDGIHGIALEFAAYLVTVVERHFGSGDWQRDDSSFGADSFPFHWRGSTL